MELLLFILADNENLGGEVRRPVKGQSPPGADRAYMHPKHFQSLCNQSPSAVPQCDLSAHPRTRISDLLATVGSGVALLSNRRLRHDELDWTSED
jgi:hypothetical protein